MSGLTFDDLVAAAALGVSRKGFTPAELDGVASEYAERLDTTDPAAALLDAAALLTVAGRAGVQLASGMALATGGPGGGAERELSAAGARALSMLNGRGRPRQSAVNATGGLADLLDAMRDAGYVLRAQLLPDMLDLASRTPALRPAVASVLGMRGRWLAHHRTEWHEVADAAADGPDDAGSLGDAEVWRVGRPADRRRYLARLRGRDPGAGRELLADGWTRESKEERAALLGMLGRGLSAADEEFLENALGDRAAEVRAAARRLLARLPDSAFQRRASRRAAEALRLEGDGPGARLMASLPRVTDKAALRDGVDSGAPPGWSDDAGWLLAQLVAGALPSEWTARLRMTPAQLVALPVSGAAAIDVRAGWRLAVARQAETDAASGQKGQDGADQNGSDIARQNGSGVAARNGSDAAGPELADWAAALLDADQQWVNRPPSVWVADATLAGLLPAAARAARTAALLDAVGKDARPPQAQRVMAELAGHRAPWPGVVAEAVLGALDRAAGRPLLTEFTQTLLDAAGRAMPTSGARDYAAELTRLAVATPEAMPWMPAMRAAAETITLRRAFLAELR